MKTIAVFFHSVKLWLVILVILITINLAINMNIEINDIKQRLFNIYQWADKIRFKEKKSLTFFEVRKYHIDSKIFSIKAF